MPELIRGSLTHHASFILCLSLVMSCSQHETQRGPDAGLSPFTLIAIGDAGETGSALRANASLLTNMHTGQHDGGKFDAMIFLGDNFYNVGLNVPHDEVDDYVKKILGPFKTIFRDLGRSNIHAITGNHDYYLRNAFETSLLFGLVSIAEGPIGLTEKGNKRASALDAWTYYYGLPGDVVYPVESGATDSVQFIFFDSALPLRTDPARWIPALDSLRRLLSFSSRRPGVLWRVLTLHHPIYSLGEHGGYTSWNDELNLVEYLSQCDKDSNAIGFLKNWLDPEDLCAEKYRQFLDSLRNVIAFSGARIQLSLAGHEHNMQLLSYPDRDAGFNGFPTVHVISGAGSKPSRVRFPSPPNEFTSAQIAPERKGLSVPGFAKMEFSREHVRIIFYNARTLSPMDMGGGKKEFYVSVEGTLLP